MLFSLSGYMSLRFMVPTTLAWLPLNLALVTSMLPSVLSWEPWEPSLKDRMTSSGNQFSVLFSNLPLTVVNLSSWSSELILGSHWGITEREHACDICCPALWGILAIRRAHYIHWFPVAKRCPLSRLRDPWIRVLVIWEWSLHAPHQLLALGETGSTLQRNETT